MTEHIPVAHKWRAEVDAFFELWHEKRCLAVLLLLGLALFCAWSIFSNWSKSQSIEKFQQEKNLIESRLRESERENRGLRETVAPLLARAAREFPGEEINSSLKKIVGRLESQNPLHQPIASATATVLLTIKSDEGVSAHYMDQGGYAAFAQGNNALLEASSHESWGNQTGNGEVRYRGVFTMPSDASAVGKRIDFLKQAQYLQMEFAAIPTNSLVTGGKVIFVLNDSTRLEFDVPKQTSNEKRVFVRDLSKGMQAFAPNKASEAIVAEAALQPQR